MSGGGKTLSRADLSDEDWRHGLVESRPVHVDGRADGKHEPRHPGVDLVLRLQRLDGNWNRNRFELVFSTLQKVQCLL